MRGAAFVFCVLLPLLSERPSVTHHNIMRCTQNSPQVQSQTTNSMSHNTQLAILQHWCLPVNLQGNTAARIHKYSIMIPCNRSSATRAGKRSTAIQSELAAIKKKTFSGIPSDPLAMLVSAKAHGGVTVLSGFYLWKSHPARRKVPTCPERCACASLPS